MKKDLSALMTIIKNRRTIFPPSYSDKKIKEEDIRSILEAAVWAPNHGNTEPWRFDVFLEEAKNKLADRLANAYLVNSDENQFKERKHLQLKEWPNKAACIIAVSMKKGNNSKIPSFEESRAVSCAIQNMLLTATSLGISSYWSTGIAVYSQEMKSFLSLSDEDEIIGLIYLGYSKENGPHKKRTDYSQLTRWHYEY
jgi:nitroreductase